MKSIFKTAGIAFLALSGVMSAASCSKMFEGAGMSVQRTVLVYMAADNNLSGNARRDIEEMKDGYVPYYFDEGSGVFRRGRRPATGNSWGRSSWPGPAPSGGPAGVSASSRCFHSPAGGRPPASATR